MSENLVFDAWTSIAFKRALGTRSTTSGAGQSWTAPTWVGDHRRRLMAYTILRAYVDNAAREFMLLKNRDETDNRREYGDANLIVNAVMGALLGDDQSVTVEGADAYDPNADDEGDATGAEAGEARRAWLLQEWLRDWARKERLPLKMLEVERLAVGMGDGVYSLGWSPAKGRARLRVWDPGFYFPVLDTGNEDDFPSKVHIAWEEEDPLKQGRRLLRRITWWLGPIQPAFEPGLLESFVRSEELIDGDTRNADGRIVRKYPWNDKPVGVTCYMSDGTWTLDKANSTVGDLTEEEAVWSVDESGPVHNRDLGIDFIPVVHVPNTVAILDHYGKSTLSSILQILDDLASGDTDLAAAAATTAKPVLALSKGTMGKEQHEYRPGQILETGDGVMTVLDTSRSLDAILKYVEYLLSRLSVNARLPESVLGRVKPSEVPSGVALALSFGPLEQMVGEMRLSREEKYPLLLKFAVRFAQLGADPELPDPTDLDPLLLFGSYLPKDRAEVVTLVAKLRSATPTPLISLSTAVAMLIDAGFEVEDAVAEVSAIEGRDFKGAGEMLDALGDEQAVRDYLGVDGAPPARPEPPPAQPPVEPPPVASQGAE